MCGMRESIGSSPSTTSSCLPTAISQDSARWLGSAICELGPSREMFLISLPDGHFVAHRSFATLQLSQRHIRAEED